MLVDGINLLEGSQITNAVINTGPSFPVGPDHAPDQGELFYKNDNTDLLGEIGLYTYDGANWVSLASQAFVGDQLNGMTTTIPFGTSLPAVAVNPDPITQVNGELFYKTDGSGGKAAGIYIFDFLAGDWVEASVTAGSVNASNVVGVLADANIPDLAWSKITSGKPTTLAGYGITNGQPLDDDLTSIAALTGFAGFLKTNGSGTWAVDSNSYLTDHPAVSAATSVDNSGYTFIQDLNFDSNGHVTGLVSTTVPSASTSAEGLVQLTNSTATTSSILGATATAVKSAYDLAGGALQRSGGTMTGSIVIPTGANITITDAPSNGTDAVNKIYVDANLAGLSWKNAVKVATVGPITLSGTQSIDGVAVIANDRVLVKDQATATANGIYIVAAGAWARAADFDQTTPINEVNSAAVFVEQGTVNADTGWTQINNVVDIDTDDIAFTQFNGAAGITAGLGLSKVGNTLNVNLGAGIAQLPTDEVGVDLFTGGGLITTVDGTTSSILTGAQLSLEKVGTAGTYKSVTTDDFGRITAGSNPTTLAGYGIIDAQPLDSDLTAIAALNGTAGLLQTDGNHIWSVDTSSYLIGNETITVSGDATGSGATSIALTLANSGVTAASYGSATKVGTFSVDAKGRITTASDVTVTPAWSSITSTPTTLAGYGITDAQPLDGDLTSIAALSGTSGFLKKTAANTWALDTGAYLSGNETITLSGDATGSGTTAITVTLADTTVVAGTYNNSATQNQSFTVDSKGRITGTGVGVTITPAWSSIASKPTTLSGFGITDAIESTTVPTIGAGLLSTRPVAGTAGSLFYATDTFGLYYDNGSAWALESPAVTGDISISAGSTTATLANTAVVAGTYNNSATQVTPFTVNSQGRLIATGSAVTITPAWSAITSKPTTLSGFGITDTLTLTGDVTASATNLTDGTIATTLATSGVTAGSYGSATQVGTFTVDAKGRITTASNVTVTPAWSSISSKPTTLSGFGITDAVNTSALGANNGVATLDGTGKLTASQFPSSLTGAVVYQGVWNANTNTPALASGVGTKGFYYKVSVAGTTSIDGNANWSANDVIIYNGTTWDRIDGVDAVDSVSGTTDQVTVSSSTGAITVGLATNITGVNTITLGQDPVNDAHAATKAYVDQMAMAMAIVFGS